MKIDFIKLPRKAQRNVTDIKTILVVAEDMLYNIVKVDYNGGLIRFESLQIDNLFINLYTTSFTVTIEHKQDENSRNKQYHFRNCFHKKVKRILRKPINYINR